MVTTMERQWMWSILQLSCRLSTKATFSTWRLTKIRSGKEVPISDRDPGTSCIRTLSWDSSNNRWWMPTIPPFCIICRCTINLIRIRHLRASSSPSTIRSTPQWSKDHRRLLTCLQSSDSVRNACPRVSWLATKCPTPAMTPKRITTRSESSRTSDRWSRSSRVTSTWLLD